MSNGLLLKHRLLIGVYTPFIQVEPPEDPQWLFEDGEGVLLEDNSNAILEDS